MNKTSVDAGIQGTETQVLISLDNVGFRYRIRGSLFSKPTYHQALKNVSFDIVAGETLGIVGRNGVGKSTLLRIIAGILKPDSGIITNHGATVSLLALQAGFDTELTGLENIILSGMTLGYSMQQAKQLTPEIIDFSELGKFISMPVRTYSTGMRARLGFSISLFMSPDVLLLDEVLSVGDRQFRKKADKAMEEKITSLQTVVLVSHIEDQVNMLCDRAIALPPLHQN